MSNKGWSSKVKDMSQGQVLERQELEKLEKNVNKNFILLNEERELNLYDRE